MIGDRAPHARLCCPEPALRELTPDELRALDAYCRRALDDPDAAPGSPQECAAVERYEGLLAAAAVGVWRRERRARYGREVG